MMHKIVTECHSINISLKYILSSMHKMAAGQMTSPRSFFFSNTSTFKLSLNLITTVNSEKDTLHFEMPSLHLVQLFVSFSSKQLCIIFEAI